MSAPEAAVTPGKQTTMAALKPQPEAGLPALTIGFASLQAFELTQRIAKMFANSSIVPETFRGNIGNCAIALEMASRIGASPLMVMQNLDVIYGRPAWRAKFLIGCFNQTGRFDPISYEMSGTQGKDDWGCVALSKDLRTGKAIRGPLITISLAKAEGWYEKKGSKWKTMPEQMLRYRAGAWMINTTAPEISLGLLTTEEVQDAFDARKNADGQFEVDLDSLRRPGAQAVPEENVVAMPKKEDAIAALLKCETHATLEAAYTPIVEAFVSNNENVPIEVEAAYQDRKAKIEQML